MVPIYIYTYIYITYKNVKFSLWIFLEIFYLDLYHYLYQDILQILVLISDKFIINVGFFYIIQGFISYIIYLYYFVYYLFILFRYLFLYCTQREMAYIFREFEI